jgi:Ca-activated chloride channel family protein
MTFARPDALWLTLLAPLAVLAMAWLWRQQLRAIAAWAVSSLWNRLDLRHSRRRLTVSLAAIALAVLATAVALSRPRWGTIEQMVERRGVDVVFVLDSSLSMQARDVAPSRMEIAKALVRRLVGGLPGHRMALVQAEGKGLVLSPLTVDTAVIDLLLDTVYPASLPDPGTRLGSALNEALRLFPPEGEKHRVMILVSDGEDHGSNWKESLNRLTDAGVKVHALGVGSRKGSPIELEGSDDTRYKQDSEGHVVVSRLHPEILQSLAEASGGLYIEVDSPAVDSAPLISEINSMERRTVSGEILDIAAERFQWPLAIAATATLLFLIFPPLTSAGRSGASGS